LELVRQAWLLLIPSKIEAKILFLVIEMEAVAVAYVAANKLT
jgi:hypothetical protein